MNKTTPGQLLAEELNWYSGAVDYFDWYKKKLTKEEQFAKRARYLHAKDIIEVLKRYGFSIVRTQEFPK